MKNAFFALFLVLISTAVFAAPTVPAEFEGVYRINPQCPTKAMGSFCKGYGANYRETSPLRLVLFSHSNRTTVVFYDKNTQETFYQFTVSHYDATQQEVQALSSPEATKKSPQLLMTLSVESTTGMNKTISWLRDPQFKTDIQIQGTQMDNVYRTLRRVKSGISGTQHLVLGSILGEYEGTLTSKDSPRTAPYFLRILPDAFHSDRMIGLMAPMNDDTSLPPLEFSYGYFDEQASEVNLIGPFDQLRRTKETTGESFKLGLLAFEDEAGDIKLVGASAFSNAFGLYDFTFTKK